MSSLPSPSPSAPVPAYASSDTEIRRYSTTIVMTVSVAARPGVFSGSLVSSFIVRVTSHPQKMKIDSDRPATTAVKEPTANGLNHDSSTGLASNALPWATCQNAATEKITSTSTWKVTRTYCSFWVVCMSR